MYNIQELSEIENTLIKTAPIEYEKYYDNASELVSFMSEFYYKIDLKFWLFIIFSTQVQNSMKLALLSILRRHDIQANLMLRQALESVTLACYSAYNTDDKDYAQITPEGLLNEDGKKNLRRAYIWLEEKYKTHSDKITGFKKEINSLAAHANILNAFNNTDFSNNRRIVFSFFDGNSEDNEHFMIMTKQRLWMIGNIAFGLIDLLSKVISEFNVGKLIDDFPQKMAQLGRENHSLMEELKQNPRLKAKS